MKKTVILGTVLAGLLALPALPAGAAKVKHPSDLTYPKIRLAPPAYEEIEFANGTAGFFIEDHEIPVIDIHILVSVNRSPRDKAGLNDLAAWVIRNGGSESWPADRVNDELEFVAASLEFWGGPRSCGIHMNCLTKDLPLCLSVLADLLTHPVFPDDKIELRRETMLENMRRENDQPRTVAAREFRRVVYGEHPMGHEATEESVKAITREDIVAFHKAFFHPNNAIIGISGDISRDEIVAALGESFRGWDSSPVTLIRDPEMKLRYEPSVNYAYKDLHQAVIMIGHLGLNSHDSNRPAVRIMNFILGGGSFASWITQRVRTDEGLAYWARSSYSDDPWNYGLFTASSQTRSEAAARAMSLIIELIERMKNEGPTEEEVETAKDRYLNSHVFDYESKSGVVSRLVRLRWEQMPLDTPERQIEAIGNLTVDDIRKAAQEYLHPEGLTILVVGDESRLDQPLSNFGEVNAIELE